MPSGDMRVIFRTIVNVIPSELSVDPTEMDDDGHKLSTAFRPIVRHEDGYLVTTEEEALKPLGHLNEDESLGGGADRSVRPC